MSTKLLKKEAGDIKRRPGNSRAVATVNQSYLSNVINYGFKIANQLASGAVTPTSGGSIPASTPINIGTLAILGETQAARLLGKNPELSNTNNVMLPSGAIYSRPTSELTVAQARALVSRDIAIGRKPNEYEYGLANGDILTRDQQSAAQRALYRDVGAKMVLADTFDAVPPPGQDLLRRAAGVIPTSTKVDVQLKAKVITPPSSGGGSGGGGGGIKGAWIPPGKNAHGDWYTVLERHFPKASDPAKKKAIRNIFTTTDASDRAGLESKLKAAGATQSQADDLINNFKLAP